MVKKSTILELIHNRNSQLLLLLTISFACFMSHLGIQFADYMETRNFVTAKEIIENDSWLIPTMNGELRLEKPPLPTWITAIFMLIFGSEDLFFLRLPAALTGVLAIYFVFRFVEEITREKLVPFMAAATVATSFYFMFQSRTGTWDIFCHSYMLGAILHLYIGFEKSKKHAKNFINAGFFLGLSALSKGPVSFYALLLPFLISYFSQNGVRAIKGKLSHIGLSCLIAMIISLWWPMYILVVNPVQTATVLVKESEAWISRNTRPFYHYWWFVAQSGVWTVGAILALCWPFARKRISKFSNYDLLWGWVIAGVVLLSILPEKKERYLVPILIPLGMCTAHLFYSLFKNNNPLVSKTEKLFLRCNNGIMIFIAAIIPIGFIVGKYHLNFNLSFPDILIAFLVPIVFIPLFLYATRKLDSFRSWILMVFLYCSIVIVFFPTIIHSMTNKDYKPMLTLRQNTEYQRLPVYYHGDFLRLELVWEGGKKIELFNPNLLQKKNSFVLISEKSTKSVLTNFSFKNHVITPLGQFNSSWNGRNKNLLINNVSIVSTNIE